MTQKNHHWANNTVISVADESHRVDAKIRVQRLEEESGYLPSLKVLKIRNFKRKIATSEVEIPSRHTLTKRSKSASPVIRHIGLICGPRMVH